MFFLFKIAKVLVRSKYKLLTHFSITLFFACHTNELYFCKYTASEFRFIGIPCVLSRIELSLMGFRSVILFKIRASCSKVLRSELAG